jgi:hypothetical protein
MAKIVDFSGASRRHYRDAELLMDNSRVPNAGQLLGFAAECGIKALLIAHGLKTDSRTGDIEEKGPYRTHINALINNAQTFRDSRRYSQYFGMLPNLRAFKDWDTKHRYWNKSSIPSSHTDWQKAAKEVMEMLDQAKLDRVIS